MLKLVAMAALFSIALSSCEKDDNNPNPDRSRYVPNYDFFLTNLQVVPATNSTGSGRIEGTYDKKTKIYTYKITWDNLSSNVTAIHIHGNADRGFVALPAPLGPYTNALVQSPTGFAAAKSGSLTTSLYVDGVVVREQDLLNGKYYVDIHTVNFPVSATGQGEIRGQIIFP